MTEAQIKLFNEWLYEHPCQFSALGNVQAAWEHQQQRIDDQLLTIKALNECINGKDSLTTDNLTLAGRLEQRVEDMEKKLKIAVDAFSEIINRSESLGIEGIAEKALKQIEATS